ncbi:MAG: hypothetical protein OXU74_06505 [Gemmatimonadota bacterium]|nr:hypothetical protein [Gemmatimonadota bacterium]
MDPDGDALTYMVASSDTTIVPVALHPSPVLSLAGPVRGEATVTITARDPEGLEAQATFPVAVVENPDRATLESVFEATGGHLNADGWWPNRDNWLTDAPLGDWYGVDVNEAGRVSCFGWCGKEQQDQLSLRRPWWANPEPRLPQLGDLEGLEELVLRTYGLEIPPELGRLSQLRILALSGLLGEIPQELGNLRNLRVLILDNRRYGKWSAFTGPIPATLGNLTKLENLILNGGIEGSIPSELGRLADLKILWIEGSMTGPVPAEIGDLSELVHLRLAGLHLSGPLPPTLQNLGALDTPWPGWDGPNHWNHSYTGLYIGSLCRLRGRLGGIRNGTLDYDVCDAFEADLCVPSESMRKWLSRFSGEGNPENQGSGYNSAFRVPRPCDGAMQAHLVQAVQAREPFVPLVAGEPAALRLFGMSPPLQARFYLNGGLVHTVEIASIAFDAGTTAAVVAGPDSNMSAEGWIPGHLVRPGLEFVVEGDDRRFPATGRQEVDVREVPSFNLTVVPLFLENQGERSFPEMDSRNAAIADSMAAADPKDYWRLRSLVDLLPVRAIVVTKHPPIVLNQDTLGLNYGSLRVVAAVRAMSGGTGHWMGLGQPMGPVCCLGGIAQLYGTITVVARPAPTVIAHEVGHNFGLLHPMQDPEYPHQSRAIGAWGFAVRSHFVEERFEDWELNRYVMDTVATVHRGQTLGPYTQDLMMSSYPEGTTGWISDYHFSRSFDFRIQNDGAGSPLVALSQSPVRSLLLWGGFDTGAGAYLEPVFVVDAPPSLPEQSGPWTIEGRDTGGRVLFTLPFAMPEIADAGQDAGSFAYTLPVRPGLENLASVTLSGPGGTATLDESTDRPMSIYRDVEGKVRAILQGDPVQADGGLGGPLAGVALDVVTSRGIPSPAAWRR